MNEEAKIDKLDHPPKRLYCSFTIDADGFPFQSQKEQEATIHRIEQLLSVCRRADEIFFNRNIEYGDAIRGGGFIGATMECLASVRRLRELTKRLHQWYWTGGYETDSPLPNHLKDPIKDTLLDLHNYSAIALMMLEERNIEGELL